MTATAPIQAIDVHAHLGRCSGSKFELLDEFCSGDAALVVERATLCHTQITIVSPLEAMMPALQGDPVKANAQTARIVECTEGARAWGARSWSTKIRQTKILGRMTVAGAETIRWLNQ